jgi:hypothetical protein
MLERDRDKTGHDLALFLIWQAVMIALLIAWIFSPLPLWLAWLI